MYFCEWLTWLAAIEPKGERDAFLKKNKKFRNRPVYAHDENIALEVAKQSVSKKPKSRGPVYAINENILEIRCGMWEEKRGLISIISAAAIALILTYFYMSLKSLENLLSMAKDPQGGTYGTELLMGLFALSLGVLVGVFYLKYCLKFTRLEMFTSRHLLVRFNRVTQQVYLHRPHYCGGVTVLPWKGVVSSGSDKNHSIASGVGLPLALTWSSNYTGTLRTEMIWVGKSANNFAELQAEWEFIRRFMDEGPESLPRPRITSHFPWPWQAFTPQFEGLTHYLRTSSKLIKCGLVLISPAFLIIGTGHWLSLMLCWKPRWPKIIREAGLPGKPIPPITTVEDYPPHIQERLRENAYMWVVHPGKRPERKKRATTRRRKADLQVSDSEKIAICDTTNTDLQQTSPMQAEERTALPTSPNQ